MELTLLRHAQPKWTTEAGVGASDPELTVEGIRRCQELAQTLGNETFQSVAVSSYRRSQETAHHIFGDSEKSWTTQEWLREIRLPDLSSQPAEQVGEFFADIKKRPLETWWKGLPGGESFEDFHYRVSQGLLGFLADFGVKRLRPDHEHDRHLFTVPEELLGTKHLLVSHLGTTGIILSELLHLELVPWVWETFALDWNGIVRVETVPIADGHLFCLRVFNERGHRDPSLGYHPTGVGVV